MIKDSIRKTAANEVTMFLPSLVSPNKLRDPAGSNYLRASSTSARICSVEK